MQNERTLDQHNDDEATPLLGEHGRERHELPTATVRATAIGLLCGTLVCVSNVYFGLQNGYANGMSMTSSVLGFAVFQLASPLLKTPFGPRENAFLQAVSSGVGFMPTTAGLVGIVPALEFLLKPNEGGHQQFGWGTLIVWSLGLAFFGTTFAMLLRHQFLDRNDLPFPSATATATIIDTLHKKPGRLIIAQEHANSVGEESTQSEGLSRVSLVRMLTAFGLSGALTVVATFVPILHNLPFLGTYMSQHWFWTFNVSAGMVGQGMITGPAITSHMLAGTVVGWAILSPIVKTRGWAPGNVDDWDTGSRGWLLWVALAALLADCIVNTGWMLLNSLLRHTGRSTRTEYDPRNGDTLGSSSADYTDDNSKMAVKDSSPTRIQLLIALLLTTILCIGTTRIAFPSQVPIIATAIAVVLSLLLSIASVRSMGQTDYSPVNGLGKLSQFVFAMVIPKTNPSRYIINLTVGAIAEAGASSAADLIYDLKTGYLLGADPGGLMLGFVLGTSFGSIIAGGLYKLYSRAYPIPGSLFQVPSAYMWVFAARLAYGSNLPHGVIAFACAFALFFALIAGVKAKFNSAAWTQLLPSGVAFAIGMYNPPAFTLPRAVGGFLFWYLHSRRKVDANTLRFLAAGLILGESLFSLIGLIPMH